MLTPASRIAILGYGGGAARLAAALAPRGCAVRVHDARLADADVASRLRAHIEAAGLDACDRAEAALQGARLVVIDEPAQPAALSGLPWQGQTVVELRARDAQPLTGLPPSVALVTGRFDGAALALRGERAQALAAALRELGVMARAVERLPDTPQQPASLPSLPDTAPHVPRAELL